MVSDFRPNSGKATVKSCIKKVTAHNFGRTSAKVTSYRAGFYVGEKLPDTPSFQREPTNSWDAGMLVDGQKPTPSSAAFALQLTQEIADELNVGS